MNLTINSLMVDSNNDMWYGLGIGDNCNNGQIIEMAYGSNTFGTAGQTMKVINGYIYNNSHFGLCGVNGVAVDSNNNIYFSQDGANQTAAGATYYAEVIELAASSNYNSGAAINFYGQGQLEEPDQIAIDGNNRIIVADPGAGEVFIFNHNGSIATILGGPNDPRAGFTKPTGVAVGSEGNIWVADGPSNTLYKFSKDATGNAAPLQTITSNALNHPHNLVIH